MNFVTSFLSELNMENIDKHKIQPQAGLLVIFPSDFWHSTMPFTGDSERICISFNFPPLDK